MGTSQATRTPQTKRWKNVPASLRSPVRNASTVIDAVVTATVPLIPPGLVSTPTFYAIYQGVRFAVDVREVGLERAAERAAIRISEQYVAPSIAKALWDAAASNMDPQVANSPFGKLAETAFKKTVTTIISKGVGAMVEERHD